MAEKTKTRKELENKNFDFDSFYLSGLHPEFKEIEKRWKEKAESDAALIESLNRYIETIETKSAYQADVIKDLKKQLKELLAKPKYKRTKKT